jgi:CBS domain-containing protein
MMQVADVLAKKGRHVYVVPPVSTVLAATQLMNRQRIGALVVVSQAAAAGDDGPCPDCERVLGIFTERDVLTRVVARQRDPGTTLVEEVMTTNVAYCRPEMDLDDVGAVMRQRRIRHLPVCDAGRKLVGLISIGDVNAWHARGKDIEISYLHEYIHGRV